MAGKFAALWPTDPKFSSIKDLNLLKKHIKNQEASSILRVVFALSNWPHLHREFSNRPLASAHNCMCLIRLFLFHFMLFNANEQWSRYFNSENSYFFSFFISKIGGFGAKCQGFQGFKKPRIAKPRITKPRIARTPCIRPNSDSAKFHMNLWCLNHCWCGVRV